MAKEIKNNIAAMVSLRGAKRRSNLVYQIALIAAALVLGFAMPAFATYTPPVGNNNDVQYKNGFGFAGSDNFVVNGTNIGIGTTIPQGGFVVMNGNVGIGTWVPTAAISINGNINFPTDNTYSIGTSSSSGRPKYMYLSTELFMGSSGDFTGSALDGSRGNSLTIDIIANTSDVATQPIIIQGEAPYASATTNKSGGQVYISGGTPISGGSYGSVLLQTSGGNVGIGTTVPGAALDVEGSLYPTVFYGHGTDYNVGIGSLTPGTALDVNGVIRSTSGGFTFPDGSTQTSALGNNSWSMSGGNVYTTNGSNNVGIGTTTPQGGLVVTNGNVGIGTWSPGGALIVKGSVGIGVNNPAYVLETSGNVHFGGFGNVYIDGGSFIGATTGEGMAVGHSPNTLSITNGSGGSSVNIAGTNVGIGSAAPGQALDVTGTVRATGFIAGAGGITLGGVNNTSWPSGGASNWTYTSSGNVGLSTTANVGIGTSFVGGTGEAALTVMNGNVGIGTWVPLNPFQVNTPSSQNFYITPTGNVGIGAGPDQNLTVSSGSTTRMDVISGSTFMSFGADPTNGPFYLYNSSQSLRFASASLTDGTGFAERMRIDTQGNVGIGTTIPVGGLAVMNGNVGIGTWVPGSTVDVKGTLNVSSTGAFGNNVTVTGTIGCNSSASCTIQNPSTSATPSALIIKGGANAGSNLTLESTSKTGNGDYIDFEEGNVGVGTVDVMRMVNGNVGIGTWVPANLLDISSGTNHVQSDGFGLYFTSSGTAQIKNVSGSSVSGMNIIGGTGISSFVQLTATGYGSPNTGYITFNTGINGGTRAMLIDNSGNVGIGTSTTVGGLAVMNGNVGIGTWIPKGTLDVGSTGTICLGGTCNSSWPAGGGSSNWIYSSSGNVGLSTTAAVGIGTTFVGGTGEASFSVMNGNVGIGTWAPRESLEVNNNLTYSSMYSNGNSGTSFTINWNKGNNQSITLTGNVTFTFTAPGGVSRLLLKLIQDETGSRTATWPGTVEWSGGSAPTLTSTAGAIDFVSCFYDGTDYFCSYSLNFSP